MSEIADVRDGEILVCGSTSPAWAPIFSKIRATVTDVGGVMSHAAIVCREYGLPGGGRHRPGHVADPHRPDDPRRRLRGRGDAARRAAMTAAYAPAGARCAAPTSRRSGARARAWASCCGAAIPVPPGFALSTAAFARSCRVELEVVDEALAAAVDDRRCGRRGGRTRSARRRAPPGADASATSSRSGYRELGDDDPAGGGALERGRRGQRAGDVRRSAGDATCGCAAPTRSATRCATAGPASTARPAITYRARLGERRAAGDGGDRAADGRRRRSPG